MSYKLEWRTTHIINIPRFPMLKLKLTYKVSKKLKWNNWFYLLYPLLYCNTQKKGSETPESMYILDQQQILNWVSHFCPSAWGILLLSLNLAETLEIFARRLILQVGQLVRVQGRTKDVRRKDVNWTQLSFSK